MGFHISWQVVLTTSESWQSWRLCHDVNWHWCTHSRRGLTICIPEMVIFHPELVTRGIELSYSQSIILNHVPRPAGHQYWRSSAKCQVHKMHKETILHKMLKKAWKAWQCKKSALKNFRSSGITQKKLQKSCKKAWQILHKGCRKASESCIKSV